MVARGARRAGQRVVVIGLRGLADRALREHILASPQGADRFYWSGVVRLGRWIRIFRREGVRRAVMAGSVRKREMYGRFRLLRYLPDWTSIKVWFFRARDKRNDSLLSAAADEMALRGVMLESCVQYCAESLAGQGVLTRRSPPPGVLKDIEFGWRIAKELGRLDIGQAVAVKEQEVIAVEAIEGTDEMIRRAGQLCRVGGWTLVKAAKPNQDMRFDVPTVGPETIRHLAEQRAAALVVEAGKTVIIDLPETLALAERADISVIGRWNDAP